MKHILGAMKVYTLWDPIDPIECTLSLQLEYVSRWPEDGCLQAKHVAKIVN